MTQLVRQRTTHDCSIACFAMLTGRPYDEVIAAVGDTFDAERGMADHQTALERLGFRSTWSGGQPVGDFVDRRRGILAPEFFRGIAWGRRALLTVPSLNKVGGWHHVYYDGRDLFDPSQQKTYSDFTDLLPDEITLFREAR